MSDNNIFFDLDRVRRFFLNFFSSIVYFISVSLLLRDYASVEWSLYRIQYDLIDSWDVFLSLLYISIASFLVPSKMNSPSSLFIIIVYIFI
jgi:hypothetical protein